MLTKEQADKQFKELLLANGTKDTQLEKANEYLNGNEIVAVVQNGESKKLNILDFLKVNVDNIITIDDALNFESKFPVQNAVVAKAIDELKEIILTIGNPITLKGTVYTKEELPKEGNELGDLWIVKETGEQYVWIVDKDLGKRRWEVIGSTKISLANYYTKEEAHKQFLTKPELDDIYVPKSQLEKLLFSVSIDPSSFMVTTDTAKQIIKGSVSSVFSKVIANSSGKPDSTSVGIVPTQIKITIKDKDKNDLQVIELPNTVTGEEVYSNTPFTSKLLPFSIINTEVKESGTVVADIKYNNVVYSRSCPIYFNYAKYFTLLDKDDLVNEENITNPKKVGYTASNSHGVYYKTSKLKFNTLPKRPAYAYPSYLGNVISVKDSNNFEVLGSFTKETTQINGINYTVYVLTNPALSNGISYEFKS